MNADRSVSLQCGQMLVGGLLICGLMSGGPAAANQQAEESRAQQQGQQSPRWEQAFTDAQWYEPGDWFDGDKYDYYATNELDWWRSDVIDRDEAQQRQERAPDRERATAGLQYGQPPVQLDGTIQEVGTLKLREIEQENVVALVEMEGGQKFLVDLGPSDRLPRQQIREGKKLQARGRYAAKSGQSVMIAQHAQVGDERLNITPLREQQWQQIMSSQPGQQPPSQEQIDQVAQALQEAGADREEARRRARQLAQQIKQSQSDQQDAPFTFAMPRGRGQQEIRGQIVRMGHANSTEGRQHLLIQVLPKKNEQVYVVDLGAAQQARQLNLQLGDAVKVKGRVVGTLEQVPVFEALAVLLPPQWKQLDRTDEPAGRGPSG